MNFTTLLRPLYIIGLVGFTFMFTKLGLELKDFTYFNDTWINFIDSLLWFGYFFLGGMVVFAIILLIPYLANTVKKGKCE